MGLDVERAHNLGVATLEPNEPAAVGSHGTWYLTYRPGADGIAAGGAFGVAWVWPSDWGEPQFADPAGENYTTARTASGAPVELTYDREGYVDPYQKLLLARLPAGLASGDELVVTLGDTARGGPGCRVQTFRETRHQFVPVVDADGSGALLALAEWPSLPVRGGPAVRLAVVAPSEVTVGEPFALLVRAEDEFGNPASAYAGSVHLLGSDGSGDQIELGGVEVSEGLGRVAGLTLPHSGIWQLAASGVGLTGSGNPLVCRKETRPYRLLWGDIHGQCEIGCGAGSLREYYAYARDVAGVDITSNQPNCFQVTQGEWKETLQACREFNEPGRFATLLGYEWSGDFELGGDHNVYLPGDDGVLHRASHKMVRDKSDVDSDLPHINDVFAEYEGSEALVVAHVGGRRANLEFHAPGVQRLLEVQSAHGRFEWFLREALERGYRVGFIAGSDGVMGRPGNDRPGYFYGRNVRGGLAGIYAREHSRAGILEALRARRCYGTSGVRIDLWLEVDGQPMGSEFRTSKAPRVQAWALGTGPLEGIELYRGLELIYQTPAPGLAPRDSRRLLVKWSGAKLKGTGRLNKTVWDGELSLSAGRILAAEPYGFAAPQDALLACGERRVQWRSVTAGDADGVLLTVDAPAEAELCFQSEPVSFSLRLGALGQAPNVVPAGMIECEVSVERLPLDERPRGLSFAYLDEGAKPGVNAYWVRVLQDDDERAWSSPVYVEFE
ncbi:MAG: DUF3604 domain-containing protein [Chloroflexi bacterium]|nr:DUF3604 domain-containing protein [Chloroflexota bacterium]MCL5107281.1 DUF3604 domain-containing protein [Chloroflexota bacterium]